MSLFYATISCPLSNTYVSMATRPFVWMVNHGSHNKYNKKPLCCIGDEVRSELAKQKIPTYVSSRERQARKELNLLP